MGSNDPRGRQCGAVEGCKPGGRKTWRGILTLPLNALHQIKHIAYPS